MENTHGGKRPKAGRKHKYGEPSKQVLVPVSLVKAVQDLIDEYLKGE